MSKPAEWQREFIERVGSVADVTGLPPSYTQVFAWLVVCEPVHQSVNDIRAALGLSSGAVSAATAALTRTGLVERVAQPGQRRLYYRFRPGGWGRTLQSRIDAASQMRLIADEALAHAPQPPPRLVEMRDVYRWFEENMTALISGSPWA